jgi:hypothetical protein
MILDPHRQCASQPAVAADLVVAYARSQAVERACRWADKRSSVQDSGAECQRRS